MTGTHPKSFGNLIEEFTVDRANMVMRFIIATTIFCVFTTPLLIFPLALINEREKPTLEEAFYVIVLMVLCTSATIAGFLLVRSVWLTTRNQPKVILYEEALAYSDRNGESYIRWEDIDRYEKSFINVFITVGKLTLGSIFGKKIEVRWIFQNSHRLMAHISHRATVSLVQQLIKKLRHGETLKFGNIILSPQELKVGGLRFDWWTVNDLGFSYSSDFSFLSVESTSKNFMCPVSISEGDRELLAGLLLQKDRWLDHLKGNGEVSNDDGDD